MVEVAVLGAVTVGGGGQSGRRHSGVCAGRERNHHGHGRGRLRALPFRAPPSTPPKQRRARFERSVTDEAGCFRFAALNPGRYFVTVELDQFQDAQRRRYQPVNGRNARPRQTDSSRSAASPKPSRSRRKSRPCRWRTARGARPSPATTSQNIQMKGRDIFGLLARPARRAGHEPESRLLVVDVPRRRSRSTARRRRTRTSGSTASTSSTRAAAAPRSST